MSHYINNGVKYLGLIIMPNDYLKRDWAWMASKIEGRINLWCNKWLSKGGRSVMMKSILEAKPIYYASISYIIVGTIDSIKQICFNFLWRSSENKSACTWITWKFPKEPGGWGLAYYPSFVRALATKGIWRLISREGQWVKVIH